jgi:hypothetical protein
MLEELRAVEIDWQLARDLFALIFVIVFGVIYSAGIAIGMSVVSYRFALMLCTLVTSVVTDFYDSTLAMVFRRMQKRGAAKRE